MLGQRVHRPDRDLAIEVMQEAHAGEARFRHLRCADRVIGAGGLAATLRVEPGVALAEVHEPAFHAVRNAEIEVPAMGDFEEARGAQVPVGADAVDIGPQRARGLRHVRLAGQILAALDDRRGRAEVEAEQSRLLRRALQQPGEHFLARPDMPGPDQARR